MILTARKADVESSNWAIITTASSTFVTMTDELTDQLSSFRIAQDEFAEDVKGRMHEFSEREAQVGLGASISRTAADALVQNLAATLELVSTRLAHLETASHAILRTSHSIDDQGQGFAQLVETIREELFESVTHLAARAQEQQKAQSDAILAGLAAHSIQVNRLNSEVTFLETDEASLADASGDQGTGDACPRPARREPLSPRPGCGSASPASRGGPTGSRRRGRSCSPCCCLPPA